MSAGKGCLSVINVHNMMMQHKKSLFLCTSSSCSSKPDSSSPDLAVILMIKRRLEEADLSCHQNKHEVVTFSVEV